MKPSRASILLAAGAATAFLIVLWLATSRSQARVPARIDQHASASRDGAARRADEARLDAPAAPTAQRSALARAEGDCAPGEPGSELASAARAERADPISPPRAAPTDEPSPGQELQRVVLDGNAPIDERVRALETLRLLEAGHRTTLRSDEVLECGFWLIENAPEIDDRRDAVAGMSGIRRTWAVERLGDLLLRDPYPEVRQKIARVLAGAPPLTAAPFLQRALETEPDARTRATLEELVGQL